MIEKIVPNLGLCEEYKGRRWNYAPFIESVHTLLGCVDESSGKGFRFAHVLRVFQTVSQMCHFPELAKEDIDWPLVKVAALYHDVGVRVLYDRYGFLDVNNKEMLAMWSEQHASLALDLTRNELTGRLRVEEIDEVCRLILHHNDYQSSADISLKVLQDADNMDELGNIFFWRLGGYAHNHGKSVYEQIQFYFRIRPELLVGDKRLHFASSREVSRERAEVLDKTVLALWQQINGVDVPFTKDSFPWDHWESKVKEKGWVIDRPKGSRHPRYNYIVYPVDYGYLPDTLGWDGMEQDIFVGNPEGPLVGVILTADFHKGDREFKILWGLSSSEVRLVHDFFNKEPHLMTGVLIPKN